MNNGSERILFDDPQKGSIYNLKPLLKGSFHNLHSAFIGKALTTHFRQIYDLENDHSLGTHLFSSCCDVAVSDILETHQDR